MIKPEGRTKAIYEAIIHYKSNHDGNSPTLAELMDMTSIPSKSVINGHVKKLVDWGYLKKEETGTSRGIKVVGARWLSPDEVKEQRHLSLEYSEAIDNTQ